MKEIEEIKYRKHWDYPISKDDILNFHDKIVTYYDLVSPSYTKNTVEVSITPISEKTKVYAHIFRCSQCPRIVRIDLIDKSLNKTEWFKCKKCSRRLDWIGYGDASQ